MAIVRLFTPEVAIATFGLLVLFFLSITFPAKRSMLFLMVLYGWRAGVFVIADAAQTLFDKLQYSVSNVHLEIVMIVCDGVLLYALYVLFKKCVPMTQKQFPWAVNFILYALFAGFFASTLYMLFPIQAGTLLPVIGRVLFENPVVNLAWYILPLIVMACAHKWVKGNAKNIRVTKV